MAFPPERAPLVDLAFAGHLGPSAADFAVVLAFPESGRPSVEALAAGARRAVGLFPKSQCLLRRDRWVQCPELFPEIATVEIATTSLAHAWMERDLAVPMQIDSALGVRQHLIRVAEGARCLLYTRVHHALGDAMSAGLWLWAQLGDPGRLPSAAPLRLKRHANAQRRSAYAFSEPCELLQAGARAPDATRVGRGFFQLSFEASELRSALRAHAFTFNDLLAAVVLETARSWNAERGAGERVGLWIPMSVREDVTQGFGNGSSRIRVYRQEAGFASWSEAAASLRKQVQWSKEKGEWQPPRAATIVEWLPRALQRKLIRAFLRRPGIDMGTLVFSHVERMWPPEVGGSLSHAEHVSLIAGARHPHAMVVSAAGWRGRTHLTLTWDASVFSPEEAHAWADRFEALRRAAFAEVLGQLRAA